MTKNITISVIAIVAVCVAVVGINYLSGTKAPRSNDLAPVEGSVSHAELDKAADSLKSAIDTANRLSGTSGASFDFQAQTTYGHYANFGVVQNVNEVKSVGLVDEMAIVFSGKSNDDHAEVDPKNGQVIAFHRSVDYSSTAAEKTQVQIEAEARAFLSEIYPAFTQIEPTLTFSPGMKGVRLNNGNYFFSWDDLNYQKQLPNGVETERAPFIQVGITASGYIFNYNNTVDLYRSALQEFKLTQ
jgi:hypothetical protein